VETTSGPGNSSMLGRQVPASPEAEKEKEAAAAKEAEEERQRLGFLW